MRLATYRSGTKAAAAVHAGDDLLDVGRLFGGDPIGIRPAARGGTAGRARASARGHRRRTARPGSVELLPPVPDPEKIVCVGLNYRTHAEEAGIEAPEAPTIFAKYRNALAAPGATVSLPAASAKVDYEAEIAFVIGRRSKQVDRDQALGAVAGYMPFNDLSARDLQFATPQWMPGKVFDDSAPCGPELVTPEDAGPEDASLRRRQRPRAAGLAEAWG